MDTHSLLSRAAAVPLLLAATLALAGCSGGAGSNSGADTMSAEAPAAAREAGAADGAAGAADNAGTADRAFAAALTTDESVTQRSVISTGVVSLLDDDVAQARFDVQKVVDARGGEVAEEKTQTDEDGEVSRSRLVVRIPVADFDATMEELEGIARLESSSRSTEDVTTEVIDNAVRIRAQTASLRRVEVLLARARSIRDIVAIEAQLTRRQADLDSLKSRQAYLDDQTSMSTITVFLAQPPEKAKAEEDDADGFVAGLRSGWHALTAVLVGGATVVGALLPFSVLFVLVGLPAWLLVRRVRAGRTGRTPSAA